MRYRDSDAPCLAPPAPQHAAPFGFRSRRRPAAKGGVASPIRRLTRQLLQLIIMALAWAAGLGIVVGSIVLVVMTTAPGHTMPQRGLARQDPASQHPAPYSAALGPGRQAATARSAGRAGIGTAGRSVDQVLAVFSGRGDRTTGHFQVRARQAWQLQWTYHCPGTVGAAQFTLLKADMAAANRATLSTSIEEYAASGHGLARLAPTSDEHYLVVISDCSWRIEVLQANRPR
jgi:hypothetical protein